MKENQKIKCLIWDLDNTLWNGVLLEDSRVLLRAGVTDVIKTLDGRGILQSVASKNSYEAAMAKLEEFGLNEFFLYPQINWNSKSSSIKAIVQEINIGMDAVAFIDDQDFELEEVNYTLPEVRLIHAEMLEHIPDMPEMTPRFITEDSKLRRLMYKGDIQRKHVEEVFEGPQEEFLASLQMKLTISPLGEGDLQRAEELTVRTHQLNSTGYTYSYEELDKLRKSDRYKIFIAGLEDKYGTYGKIGLMLIECLPEEWCIKLLLMSCRVMSRGVGTILLNYIMGCAQKAGVRLKADFVPNDRNRVMYVTYKFSGFKEIIENGEKIVFENDLRHIQPFPDYVKVSLG